MIRAAGILFQTQDGEVLLLRRTDGQGWAFPGGGIEEGESPEYAAIREAEEETGYRVGGQDLRPWVRTRQNGVDFTTYLVPIEKPFDPVLNDEHDEFLWIHPSEIEGPERDDAGFKEEEHPRDEKGRFTSGGVKTYEDLKGFAERASRLPKDTESHEHFYHSPRSRGELESILEQGLRPGASGKTWLSKNEIRDRGAGYAIVRIPRGQAKKGRDFVEPGLEYEEWTVQHPIPPEDVVGAVRAIPLGSGGHTMNEDVLAKWAVEHQNEDASDLPDQYQEWFTLQGRQGPERDDAEFKEEEHPRGEKGSGKGSQFVKKGEGGGGPSEFRSSKYAEAREELRRITWQYPERQPSVGLAKRVLNSVADVLSIPDKERRFSVSEESRTFELDGESYFYAGSHRRATKEVTLYVNHLRNDTVAKVAAHELMHQKWETVWDRYLEERTSALTAATSATERGLPDVLTHDGKVSPRYSGRWPVFERMVEQPITNIDRLAVDDGCTNYSREWWEAADKHSKGPNRVAWTQAAVHETLAEMSSLDWEGELENSVWYKRSEAWKYLYEAVNDLYPLVVGGSND